MKVIEVFAKNEATDDMCAFIMRILRLCDGGEEMLWMFKHFFKEESESASPAPELDSGALASRTTKLTSLNLSNSEI